MVILEKHMQPADHQKHLIEVDLVKEIFIRVYRDHLESEEDQIQIIDDLIRDLDSNELDLKELLKTYQDRFNSDDELVL
jgi:hypothetical protein